MIQIFPKVSFCIPVYNESQSAIENLNTISNGLNKLLGRNGYEIIVVENRSTDNTYGLIKQHHFKNLKIFKTQQKGLGVAYRKAIENAKYDNIILSAIDLPFGFTDLKNANNFWGEYDIIFGSKAHPQSKLTTTLKRNIYSFVYRILLRLFFNIKIRDTQGSVFLRKSKVKHILKYCDSNNAFFTAQLAIYGHYFKLRMTEIPVIMQKNRDRISKFTLLDDGKRMFFSIIQEYKKIQKLPASSSAAAESSTRKSSTAGKSGSA